MNLFGIEIPIQLIYAVIIIGVIFWVFKPKKKLKTLHKENQRLKFQVDNERLKRELKEEKDKNRGKSLW